MNEIKINQNFEVQVEELKGTIKAVPNAVSTVQDGKINLPTVKEYIHQCEQIKTLQNLYIQFLQKDIDDVLKLIEQMDTVDEINAKQFCK